MEKRRLCRKFAPQLRVEAQLPEWFESHNLKELCTYELMRFIFVQPWSKCTWATGDCPEIGSYNAQEHVLARHLYSTLARLVNWKGVTPRNMLT
jgi:hypothetical protein